ncbi:MAG: TonB-dependent receptor, partial [Bacteroides sp.]|nr:TonB-dependent receptor [Bacteroides sp.]
MLLFSTASSFAGILPEDTTKVIDIEEIVVIASPKETSKLKQLPASVSLISQQDMQAHQVTSLKRVSGLVPNLYIPDYGSRLTSAMYIRGIGSRINTPAVGMYVDNIPYLDKSAFDFNFYDIERLDILRGPQGTLYGRNTMGGLVKVHTRSPFSYQGTDVKLGFATGDNHRNISLTHYHRISERFAFSAGGYYEGSDGFFTNEYSGEKVDEMQAGGGRIRAVWLPGDNWKLDFSVNYDYTDEGGYPYEYEGVIAYNRESSYRRSLLNTGLNVEHQADEFIFNAVTGFQHLKDRMFMDQDFSPLDTYTLEQKQRINSISEEISFKSKPGKLWQWTTGVFGFYQSMTTDSPVNFHQDGMSFLNNAINGVFPDLSQQGMSMSLALKDESLYLPTLIKTPVLSGAVFHQSTFHLGRWELTAGLRLDYEHLKMEYDSRCRETTFDFTLTSQMMPIALTDRKAESHIKGTLNNDYTQLLPKVAVKYNFDKDNNLYATVSKGYRSGGYNLQMFSDLAQTGLRNSIQENVKSGVAEQLQGFAQMGMPDRVIGMINGMMEQYLVSTDIDVKASTVYKPEYSWNYEIGSHLNLFGGKLQADMAV